jgi:hypothetical protein
MNPVDGELLALAGLYETWQDPQLADDDPEKTRPGSPSSSPPAPPTTWATYTTGC